MNTTPQGGQPTHAPTKIARIATAATMTGSLVAVLAYAGHAAGEPQPSANPRVNVASSAQTAPSTSPQTAKPSEPAKKPAAQQAHAPDVKVAPKRAADVQIASRSTVRKAPTVAQIAHKHTQHRANAAQAAQRAAAAKAARVVVAKQAAKPAKTAKPLKKTPVKPANQMAPVKRKYQAPAKRQRVSQQAATTLSTSQVAASQRSVHAQTVSPHRNAQASINNGRQIAQPKVSPIKVRRTLSQPTRSAGVNSAAAVNRGSDQALSGQRAVHRTPQVSRAQVRHAVSQPRTTHRAVTATAVRVTTPKPATTKSTTTKARSAMPSTGGNHAAAVGIAASLTGIPYVWSGSSPAGVDCSGYVALVFSRMGITLPHQSEAIKAMTTPTANPKPGDLVFYPGHVGIYAGGGKVYEALHAGTVTGLYDVRPGATFGTLP